MKIKNSTKKFKSSGVKKVLLLCAAPNVQENFTNVKLIWSALDINDLLGTVATDLKLANIITGLMTHTSTHPCSWCDAQSGKLNLCGNSRSIGNCVRNYECWIHEELWCDWVWDSFLCWPPTKAGSSTKLRCPLEKGVDPSKYAEKNCGENGQWEGRKGSVTKKNSPIGWTNYTPCFRPELQTLIQRLYTGSDDEATMKLKIAEWTRILEFVGLTMSLVGLLFSLGIFNQFRSLRNTRTRIHKNLFVAIVIQVVIRLILYIDQELLRNNMYASQFGIENTPVLCEISYALLEYARTAMFMWMFIEGFFLHNIVSVSVFQESSSYRIYRLVGWGPPALLTLVWAGVTSIYLRPTKCWWGYNLTPYFWILEGPRMGIILVNFLFLVNIIRVLVVKLQQSHSSETEQVRKAVKAAVVLLPLLGITNLLSMTEAPLDKSVWAFACWSFTTHFLTSFQGLLIASIYCFFNGEVRLALDKTISVHMSIRGTDPSRRQSTFSGCQPHRVSSVVEIEEEELRSNRRIKFCFRGNNAAPTEEDESPHSRL